MSTLLLSIHPRHVDKMRSGEKTCELRKAMPRPDAKHILIYETAPTSAIVGSAYVLGSTIGDRLFVRERTEGLDGINGEEFLRYFSVADAPACAIWLDEFRWLETPVPLHLARNRLRGFTPPQSFRYLDDIQVRMLVHDSIELAGVPARKGEVQP